MEEDTESSTTFKINRLGLESFSDKMTTGFYVMCFGLLLQLLAVTIIYNLLNSEISAIFRSLESHILQIIGGLWFIGLILQILGLIIAIKGVTRLSHYLDKDVTNQDHNLDIIIDSMNRSNILKDSKEILTEQSQPPRELKPTNVDSSGFEWLYRDDVNWYRTAHSHDDWIKFEN